MNPLEYNELNALLSKQVNELESELVSLKLEIEKLKELLSKTIKFYP